MRVAETKCREEGVWPGTQRKVLPLLGALLVWSFCSPMAVAGQGDAAAGKAVFMNQCAVCHGEDASGKTPVAKSLNVSIPDYRSEKVHNLSDEDIKKAITQGMGNMPTVG